MAGLGKSCVLVGLGIAGLCAAAAAPAAGSEPEACLPVSTGVAICSPRSGLGAETLVTITAGARAGQGQISAIRAYLDNAPVFTINNPSASRSQQVRHAITVGGGAHHLVVLGYQSTGGQVSGSVYFTVGKVPGR